MFFLQVSVVFFGSFLKPVTRNFTQNIAVLECLTEHVYFAIAQKPPPLHLPGGLQKKRVKLSQDIQHPD
jgi:hypothetical protein